MAIRKRQLKKSTVWQVDYRDETGGRRHRQFAKRKEADAFERATNAAVDAGTHISDSSSRTVSAAADSWLVRCSTNNLEEATIASYEQHIDLHIKPFLGDRLLNKLGTEDADGFYAALAGGGRSPDMIKRVSITLGAILTHAQRNKWTAINFIKLNPYQKSKRGKTRPKMPSKAEFDRIRAHTSADRMPLLLTLAFAALRSSEARGMPWTDVDFTHEAVSVSQRADRKNLIGYPKSAAGTREIEVPPAVIQSLREWKLRCPKGELGLVFPNGIGGVENHANIANRWFYEAQIAAGVTKRVVRRNSRKEPVLDADGNQQMVVRAKYGLHSLRHFGISLWIENDFSAKEVQVLAGHASIAQTFDTYGWLFKRRDKQKARLRQMQLDVLGV